MSVRPPDGESDKSSNHVNDSPSEKSSSNVNSNKKKANQQFSIHSMDMTKKSLC